MYIYFRKGGRHPESLEQSGQGAEANIRNFFGFCRGFCQCLLLVNFLQQDDKKDMPNLSKTSSEIGGRTSCPKSSPRSPVAEGKGNGLKISEVKMINDKRVKMHILIIVAGEDPTRRGAE